MKYQMTYNEFFKLFKESIATLHKPIDTDKIHLLQQKISDYKAKLSNSTTLSPSDKKKIEMQIKICELKIMVSQIK